MATDNGRSSHEFAQRQRRTIDGAGARTVRLCLVPRGRARVADRGRGRLGAGPAGERTGAGHRRCANRWCIQPGRDLDTSTVGSRNVNSDSATLPAGRSTLEAERRGRGDRDTGISDPRRPASGEPDVQAPGSGGAAGEAATTPPSSPVPDDPTAATAPLSESRDRLDRRAGDRPTRDSEAAVPAGSHDRRAPAGRRAPNRCPPSRCLRPVPTAPARPLAATVARRPRVRRTSGPVVPSGLDPHPSRPSRRANGPILVQTPIRARRLRVGGHPSRGRTVASAGRSRCRPSR